HRRKGAAMKAAVLHFGRRLTSICLISAMICGSGCMKYDKSQVAGYTLGADQSLGVVPKGGIYSVRWTDHPGGALQAMDGTDIMLDHGDLAGFVKDEEGKLVAISGPRHLALDQLPAKARYVVWYHNERVKTQFGKEVDKAANVTGQVLVTTAGIVVIAGAV